MIFLRRTLPFALIVSLLAGACSVNGDTPKQESLEDGESVSSFDLNDLHQAEAERIEREYAVELAALERDPWFAQPAGEFSYSETISISACEKVDIQSLSVSIVMLRNAPAKRLNRDATVALIGAEQSAFISKPVLLRAFATEHSHIEVRSLNGSTVLWLGYLGSFAGASRWPCIADLVDTPPSIAFVLDGAI